MYVHISEAMTTFGLGSSFFNFKEKKRDNEPLVKCIFFALQCYIAYFFLLDSLTLLSEDKGKKEKGLR